MSKTKIMTASIVGIASIALIGSAASAMKDRGYGFGHHGMKHHKMAEKFKTADSDGDGFISKTEFKNFRASKFAQKDINSDGFIHSDEVDGIITAKVEKRADRFLQKFDKNGDGTISKDEIVARFKTKMSPRIKRRMGRRLRRLDDNWDGRVSKEEFSAKADRRFARKDKNNDGKLTLAEMKRGSHHRRGNRHHRRFKGEDGHHPRRHWQR